MDFVLSSCDIMLANYTKDPHLKITIDGLCDEVSTKENVPSSQVFQQEGISNCLIKTVVKNEVTIEAIDDLSNDKQISVFSGRSIFMTNTRIETILGNIEVLHVSNGNIQRINGNIMNADVKKGSYISKINGDVSKLLLTQNSEISKINGRISNALVENSQIGKINGGVGEMTMINGVCGKINGNISILKMKNSCKISKINGNISTLQMMDDCNISKINGNIYSLKKTSDSNIAKINGFVY